MPKKKAGISDLFDNKDERMCERCEKKMSFYTDADNEHNLWLCWGCGKFNGVTHVEDDFNDMILINPTMILELIEDKTLVRAEAY